MLWSKYNTHKIVRLLFSFLLGFRFEFRDNLVYGISNAGVLVPRKVTFKLVFHQHSRNLLKGVENEDRVNTSLRLDPYFAIIPNAHLKDEKFSKFFQQIIVLLWKQLVSAIKNREGFYEATFEILEKGFTRVPRLLFQGVDARKLCSTKFVGI